MTPMLDEKVWTLTITLTATPWTVGVVATALILVVAIIALEASYRYWKDNK